SALYADPLAGARTHDVRDASDEPRVRDRGADGPVRGVTMSDAGLGHDVPEEVLDRILVWLHRLPVLEVVQEDVIRVELDRRFSDLRVHGDFFAAVVAREIPRVVQRDFAALTA